jgi:tetratricopeptide (TPR) repeat protein
MHSHRNLLTITQAVFLTLSLSAALIQAQSRPTAEEYYKRGTALAQQGDFDRAIIEFDRAIEIKPRLAQVWCHRGMARYYKGDFDRALADLNRAIELNPRDYLVYAYRAGIWQAHSELDNAMADLSRAIEINPRYAAAYINRGRLRYDKGDRDEALADYNKAIDYAVKTHPPLPPISSTPPILIWRWPTTIAASSAGIKAI